MPHMGMGGTSTQRQSDRHRGRASRPAGLIRRGRSREGTAPVATSRDDEAPHRNSSWVSISADLLRRSRPNRSALDAQAHRHAGIDSGRSSALCACMLPTSLRRRERERAGAKPSSRTWSSCATAWCGAYRGGHRVSCAWCPAAKDIYDLLSAPDAARSCPGRAHDRHRGHLAVLGAVEGHVAGGGGHRLCPIVLYQAWAFVAPGLYAHEKRLVLPLVIASTVLFFCGMAFSYFFVFPTVFRSMQASPRRASVDAGHRARTSAS